MDGQNLCWPIKGRAGSTEARTSAANVDCPTKMLRNVSAKLDCRRPFNVFMSSPAHSDPMITPNAVFWRMKDRNNDGSRMEWMTLRWVRMRVRSPKLRAYRFLRKERDRFILIS